MFYKSLAKSWNVGFLELNIATAPAFTHQLSKHHVRVNGELPPTLLSCVREITQVEAIDLELQHRE